MANFNYGTRFHGGSYADKGGLTTTPPSLRYRNRHWWNAQRLQTLRYIMDKYNDMAKVARVLGCQVFDVRRKWNDLQHEYFIQEFQYEKDCTAQGILPQLLENYRNSLTEQKD